jgi:hypothetical protein
MAHVLALQCACGYRAKDLVGWAVLGRGGPLHLRALPARRLGARLDLRGPRGAAGQRRWICPRCRSRELAPFGDDEVPAGRCPRWNRHVMAHVVGIAD